MKQNGNRYRKHEKSTVKQLENKLSLGQRLFSVITFLRGAKHLRKWLIIASCAVLIIAVLHLIVQWVTASYDNRSHTYTDEIRAPYSTENTGTHSSELYQVSDDPKSIIHHISYNSRYGIISKPQVVDLLGISDNTDISSLPIDELQKKLNNHPAIKDARITISGANTLHIDITERIPLLYVEMADSAITGKSTKLCLSPECEIFAPDPVFHGQFVDLPTWRLNPGDVKLLAPGQTLDAELCRPVIELAKAANKYSDLTQLPHITSIERPPHNTAQWQMIVQLETGTTVEMSTLHDIPQQVERLVRVLEHARCINKKIISTNVIPEEYIPAVYAE
ncbi:MAG: FtsQ-type POTRA domain-containing protein [Akkermansiaceae bacterium]|nr:FtsQ-type POTRA domain-containing protein [Akkermansiaceae bacterium]